MRVSIVVPVYNVEQYINQCFASISKQTYNNVMLECIFVDDCGNDHSISILKQLLNDYTGDIQFKIIVHEQNKGLSEARNTGTLAATGKYVYYLDSDDEITDDCIQTLIDLADKYKNVDMILGSSEILNNGRRNDSYMIKTEVPEYSDDATWLKKSILKRTYFPMTAWNKLISIDFIKANNLFFKPGIIHEDEHWEFFVAKHIKAAAFSKKSTYIHYINEGSIITTTSPRQIECMLIIVEDFLKNIDGVLVKEQYKTIYYVAVFALIKSIDNHDRDFAIHVKKTLQHILKPRFKKVCTTFNVVEMKVLSLYFLPIFIVDIFKSKIVRKIYYGLLRIL